MASRASTLLAQPSKEWVIPPKPKPGRKPKTDDVAHVDSPKDGEQERKIMNRAAQRAFRERKQSQLADLHARIRAYEQGEVERNVQLQNLGKKLKEENDSLRKENGDLKEDLRRLQDRLDALEGRRPSVGRLEIDTKLDTSPSYPSKKRPRLSSDELPSDLRMSSRETATSSETATSLRSPSSMSPSAHHASSSTPTQTKAFISESRGALLNGSVTPATPLGSSSYEHHVHEVSLCGFCSEATPCLCREVAEATTSVDVVDGFALSPVEQKSPSILGRLPPYQPPLPIRLRTDRQPVTTKQAWVLDKSHIEATNTRFTSIQASAPSTSTATCSGDPSNCAACADDPFGRAFCTALGDSMCSRNPCPGCPGRVGARSAAYGSTSGQSTTSLPCCGDPGLCGGLCGPPNSSATSSSQQPYATSMLSPSDATIPADQAWRVIKSHPQAQFADLALLADVVARRTTCAGPSDSGSRPPGGGWPFGRTLVPQSELIEAGHRRRMQVHKEGLREAMDMLDRGLLLHH